MWIEHFPLSSDTVVISDLRFLFGANDSENSKEYESHVAVLSDDGEVMEVETGCKQFTNLANRNE